MPIITAEDGTDLYVKDWGAGRPVVLVHGWPLNADMWEYQARFLGEHGFRVVSYDRRGFGRSAQPWNGYDYDTLAGDLATIIDRLDLRDAALVGFSMGGGEVARYLGRRGGDGRVSRAVLISAVTPMLLKTDDHPDGVDRSVFDDMIEGLNNDRAQFLAGFGKTFFGVGLLSSPVSAETLQWAQSMAMMASPRATVECVRAFAATDFRADLRAIAVPTLVMHGDADDIVPIDVTARAAVKLIPGARLVEYAGGSHATVFNNRLDLNGDLLRFLRET